MNIDDFIFADEGAVSVPDSSPQPLAAPSLSGLQTAAVKKNRSSKALAAAIPIKGRKGSTNQFVAQSVPVPPHHQRGHNDEFHYVPRHDRKTSIDDRRVSTTPCISIRTQSIPLPFLFVFATAFASTAHLFLVVASLFALTCMHACISFFLFFFSPPTHILSLMALGSFLFPLLFAAYCRLFAFPNNSLKTGFPLFFSLTLISSNLLRCHNLFLLSSVLFGLQWLISRLENDPPTSLLM